MSLSKQRQDYERMVQSGMPITEAYARAFPGGLTMEQIEKEQTSDAEKAQLAQIAGQLGGTAAGVYGMKAAGSLLAGGTTAATTGGAAAGGATAAGAGTGAALSGTAAAGGSTAAGATTAGAGAGMAAGAAAAAPIAAAIAAGLNFRENFRRDRYETMSAGERMKEASKNPINYLLPAGFMGALFAKQNMWKTEQRKLAKLRDQGYMLPETEADTLTRGRSREELVNLAQQAQDAGRYGNTLFAQSRDLGDLAPIDAQGSAAMYQFAGKGQENNARLRLELAKAALAANAIQEGRGSQTIDWSKVGNANEILQKYGNLGDKGNLTPEQWDRENYAWIQQNRQHLAGMYKNPPSSQRKKTDKKR